MNEIYGIWGFEQIQSYEVGIIQLEGFLRKMLKCGTTKDEYAE
ncbi:hypothetical protein [Desulfosporosinus sp.]|nr:hypothetical protein [Desulfosporosinus sp.]